MKLNPDSPIPLYFQLKQILLEEIEKETWKPGDMLPTEQQFQEQYGVSRTTVRQTLRELEIEGKITRYRGRGTFVAKHKISHSPENYPNLSDQLIAQGSTPGWKVLSAESVMPPAKIANQLGIELTAKVFCLRRLRLENTEPIGYHIAYVSPSYADLIDKNAFTKGGSLRYLSDTQLLEHCTANRILEAVPANQEEADLLDVEKGAPMLLIRRLTVTAEHKPVEAFKGVYRGDRFEYHITNMRAVSSINA